MNIKKNIIFQIAIGCFLSFQVCYSQIDHEVQVKKITDSRFEFIIVDSSHIDSNFGPVKPDVFRLVFEKDSLIESEISLPVSGFVKEIEEPRIVDLKAKLHLSGSSAVVYFEFVDKASKVEYFFSLSGKLNGYPSINFTYSGNSIIRIGNSMNIYYDEKHIAEFDYCR